MKIKPLILSIFCALGFAQPTSADYQDELPVNTDAKEEQREEEIMNDDDWRDEQKTYQEKLNEQNRENIEMEEQIRDTEIRKNNDL